ncbi:MAG: hypothetical protein IH838_05570 [Proteobacteria bacterium]|nr:hypothetical protein [Pseudomonadota bacterium]MCZ6733790.1 hypothetical protein [Gammaproteobacteria bacterium]
MKLSCQVITLVLSAAVTACAGEPVDEDSEIPDIVEVFACSDYCPGPEEKYIKRVYDGVTDEDECRKLCGRPYTFIGWGQHTVCEVR